MQYHRLLWRTAMRSGSHEWIRDVHRAGRTAKPAGNWRGAKCHWSRTPVLAPTELRADPVELLERQAATRVPDLVPIRYGRMLVSPFAFYRGAALDNGGRLGRHSQLRSSVLSYAEMPT